MTGGRFGLPVEPDGDIDPIARMKKLTEGRTIAEFVWKASHISFIFDDGPQSRLGARSRTSRQHVRQ